MNYNYNSYFMNGGYSPHHCHHSVYPNPMLGMNLLNTGPCNPNTPFYQPHYDMYPKIVHPTMVYSTMVYPTTIVYPTIYQHPEKVPLIDTSTFCEAEPLIMANKIKQLKKNLKKLK
jgi:hypothetical protein